MKTMREAIKERYSEEYANSRFHNSQYPRFSKQPYGADKNKTELTFDEFLESYFGPRLELTEEDYKTLNAFEFELEHISYVLFDNVKD